MKRVSKKEIFFIDKIRSGKNRACLYPNTYSVGSSNLGFQRLYEKFNLFGYTVSRYFIENMELVSPDTGINIDRFDMLYISVSFETDLASLFSALINAGIFLQQRKREKFGQLRILIGGAGVIINPFLYALFADYIFIGDFDNVASEEELIGKSYFYREFRDFSGKNNEIYGEIYRKRIISHNLHNPAFSSWITEESVFSNYFLVEYSRGCPFMCKFCNYWIMGKPYREFDRDYIFSLVERASRFTRHIGFVSASVVDYDFLSRCVLKFPRDYTFHLSSIRVEEENIDIIPFYQLLNINTLTIAPETPDENNRRYLGKSISNRAISNFIEQAKKIGINKFKFYFILGLFPDEERELENFFLSMSIVLKNSFITVSFNPYIKKEFTLLQDYSYVSEEKYRNLCRGIEKLLKKQGIKSSFLPYKEGLMQTILSSSKKNVLGEIENLLEKWDSILENNGKIVSPQMQKEQLLPVNQVRRSILSIESR